MDAFIKIVVMHNISRSCFLLSIICFGVWDAFAKSVVMHNISRSCFLHPSILLRGQVIQFSSNRQNYADTQGAG